MRDNPFHNTKKRLKMTVEPLHRVKCHKRNRRGKSILRIYSSSDYKKRKSTNRCKRRSPNQQNNRIKTVRLKNTHIHTQRQEHWVHWSDDNLCWYFSPRLSRSAVRRWRRRGRSFFLSTFFFFFCIRWIQSRVHGLRTVFGPWDDHVQSVLSLAPPQLERTRAVHVTSHPTEQAADSGGGVACQRS